MRLAVFITAAISGAGVQALSLTPTAPEQTFLAQTNTQFIGRIFDLFEKFIDHILPMEPDQRMKFHGTHFNCVDHDDTKSEHGGKAGGNHDATGGGTAGGGDSKGGYASSFWGQTDAASGAAGGAIPKPSCAEIGSFVNKIVKEA